MWSVWEPHISKLHENRGFSPHRSNSVILSKVKFGLEEHFTGPLCVPNFTPICEGGGYGYLPVLQKSGEVYDSNII